ncbi:deoxyribodipyrimidine photo-lyase [Psychromonas aquatilis]|uniref:Deoxyribodipyrimidine photo-lyase n=1 Tax=Psychromonas aquatilis TaxID=2005072 RepID=A0ABU9GRF5_9GAMM
MSSNSPLLWFRNDLRTNDNPALHYFYQQLDPKQKANAIYFISEKQWRNHDWATIKIDFIKRHLKALAAELAIKNITLHIVEVDDFEAQVSYLKEYCVNNQVTDVYANSELEYNEQQRDKQCLEVDIPLTLFESDVIVPKGKIVTQTGHMYKVFTPFKRAWVKYVRDNGYQYLGAPWTNQHQLNEKSLLEQVSGDALAVSIDNSSEKWPLVYEVTEKVLPLFYKLKVKNYKNVRDIPSVKGTSGISPYLAIGALSPVYVLKTLLDKFPDILISSDSDEFTWLNEIIWREFYRHLLFDQPRLSKSYCFNDKYQGVKWHYDEKLFTAWCEGRTGYPLVDAAMRQLNETGWMHNRLRMVVASFLTKHLLIDWRLGEKYFMQHLIDGDLASNNGGWQWASSTGCDAQPYFRIFNPITQSERFDPKGTFIRKYIPELSKLPDKQIHFPHKYIKENRLSVYWPAIVEHKQARLDALAFYK